MLDPKTCLLTLHVAGLILGLGTALFLDLHLLRARNRPWQTVDSELLDTGATLVAFGMLVLWVTGLGLVWLAWAKDPAALDNPKLQAKMLVVLALTVNGWVLHRRVLPALRDQIGRRLLTGLAPAELRLALICGAISTASWATAFLFGMIREFNWAAPLSVFLAGWLALVSLAWLFGAALHRVEFPAERSRTSTLSAG